MFSCVFHYTTLLFHCKLSHTLIMSPQAFGITSPQAVGTGHHSQSRKNQNDRNLHHVELQELLGHYNRVELPTIKADDVVLELLPDSHHYNYV